MVRTVSACSVQAQSKVDTCTVAEEGAESRESKLTKLIKFVVEFLLRFVAARVCDCGLLLLIVTVLRLLRWERCGGGRVDVHVVDDEGLAVGGFDVLPRAAVAVPTGSNLQVERAVDLVLLTAVDGGQVICSSAVISSIFRRGFVWVSLGTRAAGAPGQAGRRDHVRHGSKLWTHERVD